MTIAFADAAQAELDRLMAGMSAPVSAPPVHTQPVFVPAALAAPPTLTFVAPAPVEDSPGPVVFAAPDTDEEPIGGAQVDPVDHEGGTDPVGLVLEAGFALVWDKALQLHESATGDDLRKAMATLLETIRQAGAAGHDPVTVALPDFMRGVQTSAAPAEPDAPTLVFVAPEPADDVEDLVEAADPMPEPADENLNVAGDVQDPAPNPEPEAAPDPAKKPRRTRKAAEQKPEPVTPTEVGFRCEAPPWGQFADVLDPDGHSLGVEQWTQLFADAVPPRTMPCDRCGQDKALMPGSTYIRTCATCDPASGTVLRPSEHLPNNVEETYRLLTRARFLFEDNAWTPTELLNALSALNMVDAIPTVVRVYGAHAARWLEQWLTYRADIGVNGLRFVRDAERWRVERTG